MNEKKHPVKNTPSASRPPVGNDNEITSPLSILGNVIMGLRFFSVLPTGTSPHEIPQMNRMVPALAITSVLIGLFPALVFALIYWLGLPPFLAATFGVGAQILITGGMGEDALADSFDGLFGGWTPEKRLTIMKDSTHGTYGVVAIALLVVARISALGTLIAHSIMGSLVLWIGAQMIARQCALWLVLVLPPARTDGTAHATGSLSRKAFMVGALICALLVFIFLGLFIGLIGIFIALALMAITVWMWTRFCKEKVGGYSGDLIGALQSLVEILLLSTFILFI